MRSSFFKHTFLKLIGKFATIYLFFQSIIVTLSEWRTIFLEGSGKIELVKYDCYCLLFLVIIEHKAALVFVLSDYFIQDYLFCRIWMFDQVLLYSFAVFSWYLRLLLQSLRKNLICQQKPEELILGWTHLLIYFILHLFLICLMWPLWNFVSKLAVTWMNS